MPPTMTSRSVPAPEHDWLTEAEVLTLLGDIGSRTLDRMMREGRFPRPVLWGRDGRWRWEDVAWYHLGKLLSPRLESPGGGDDDPDDAADRPPGDARAPAKGHRGASQRHASADG